jgi:hypothetical protein
VTATATGTSSSLASYIAALIGVAIDAHHPGARVAQAPGPAVAGILIVSIIPISPIGIIISHPSHSQWTRRRHFAFKVWHSMSGFKFPHSASALELQVTVAAP